MRTSIRNVLLSGCLVLTALAFGTPRPAAAQQLPLGNCVGSTEVDFNPGLTSMLATDAVTIHAIFAGCVWTGPAPVNFTWSGNLSGVSCIAINAQQPGTKGSLEWEDGTTSDVTFTGVTYVGLAGIVPAALTFTITSGHGAGGSSVVTAALVTTTYDVQQCLTSRPVKVLTGAIPTVTFTNVGL